MLFQTSLKDLLYMQRRRGQHCETTDCDYKYDHWFGMCLHSRVFLAVRLACFLDMQLDARGVLNVSEYQTHLKLLGVKLTSHAEWTVSLSLNSSREHSSLEFKVHRFLLLQLHSRLHMSSFAIRTAWSDL